ncbi:hypothetical protein EDC62_1224 [Tibeticola sediminis]|uniref:Uncharacterized protein n=1 Tax=Tibeticola sediminis TaxID=1917811 RepID=A0A3N4V0Y8_9BURK|nr:hypothetical protein [Tibeticola sediminis]RPE70737.1 hypothetical protein EDC62_1224 [Tibeticola sediminis]
MFKQFSVRRPFTVWVGAAHPFESPSGAGAALQILAMARAMAVVCALPARPMTTRSGAPNCRI